MKNKDLIEKLQKLDPELEVLQTDMDNSSHVWGIERVELCVSQGQFPEDYGMDKGFEFIRLDC